MGLTNPWKSPKPAPDEPAGRAPNCRPEPEPAHDRAPARETADRGAEEAPGEVVAFPGAESVEAAESDEQPGLLGRARGLAASWYVEARETGAAALGGSVYRSRPPALRDMHARITRAEWAGDIPVLQVAGQVAGWIGLVLNAVLYTAAWVLRRPLRWIVTALVTVIVLWSLPL